MLIIRPIQPSDFAALQTIAVESGPGFTSFPVNGGMLQQKINRSQQAFAKTVSTPFDESYLMVLEETETGEIMGTCGIESAVGMEDAFYHYRLGTEVYHSPQIGVRNELETLTLCHDYTGAAELCSLFLREDYRQGSNGRLLSRSRFLLLAQHAHRFGKMIIAEMRGVSDKNDQSPFYSWLQEHFIGIDFAQADHLSGLGQKSFMAEMMPRSPIYVSLLPDIAQAVIGEVHAKTRPALNMLKTEGFKWRNYVDIFDAGPTVECCLSDIKSIKKSRLLTVEIGEIQPAETNYIVGNTDIHNYRATMISSPFQKEDEHIVLSSEIAAALLVEKGQQVRVIQL